MWEIFVKHLLDITHSLRRRRKGKRVLRDLFQERHVLGSESPGLLAAPRCAANGMLPTHVAARSAFTSQRLNFLVSEMWVQINGQHTLRVGSEDKNG